jgi:kynureninase
VVDGYHSFAALDVDLSAVAGRVFFVAGGYKYAMTGEGACFLAVPPGNESRPLATGWFADFAGLGARQQARVGYGEGGMRFFGATFDPTGTYRLNAVMRWLAAQQLSFAAIHTHVDRLQRRFIDALNAQPLAALPVERLTPPIGIARGNFLTFALPWAEEAEAALAEHRISVDRRADRLRIGFGIYHPDDFIERLMPRLRPALSSIKTV